MLEWMKNEALFYQVREQACFLEGNKITQIHFIIINVNYKIIQKEFSVFVVVRLLVFFEHACCRNWWLFSVKNLLWCFDAYHN